MRTSTPQSEKAYSSPQLSISEYDTSDNEVSSSAHKTPYKKNFDCNILKARDNVLSLPTMVVAEISTSFPKETEEIQTTDAALSTPFKHIPTPFKEIATPLKSLLFSKKRCVDKRVSKKVTPTVATAKEFMDHQRKIELEKEVNEQLKKKRKLDMQ